MYRHCLVSCCLTSANGDAVATVFGYANEKCGDWGGQRQGDRSMGDWNYSCGFWACNQDDERPCSEIYLDLLEVDILDTDGYGAGERY